MGHACTWRRETLRAVAVLVALAAVHVGVVACALPAIHRYDYTDGTGAWDEFECPEKGRSFEFVSASFERWRQQTGNVDAVLHRTFEPEREGFLGLSGVHQPDHPRWALPYRRPE